MEYLQGRALTNAIGNLGIRDAYADALNKLGHELEEIAEQVLGHCSSFLQRISTFVENNHSLLVGSFFMKGKEKERNGGNINLNIFFSSKSSGIGRGGIKV